MIRPLTALSFAATAVALVACGSSSSQTDSTTAVAAETSATSTKTVASAEGEQLFAANCAQCHTLAAAGSSGQVGPNLDQVALDQATVKAQVSDGGAGMPAFTDVLTEGQIDAVSAYVAESAGK